MRGQAVKKLCSIRDPPTLAACWMGWRCNLPFPRSHKGGGGWRRHFRCSPLSPPFPRHPPSRPPLPPCFFRAPSRFHLLLLHYYYFCCYYCYYSPTYYSTTTRTQCPLPLPPTTIRAVRRGGQSLPQLRGRAIRVLKGRLSRGFCVRAICICARSLLVTRTV